MQWLAEYFLPEYEETHSGALSNLNKMKIFLRYMGDPGFQVGVGEDIGVDQATVSRTIWFFGQETIKKADVWIKFPQNENQLNAAKQQWQINCKFPRAIGALDCTHILIKSQECMATNQTKG